MSVVEELVLQKSKIARRQKSRGSWFSDESLSATIFSADTKLPGRFSDKRFGPSRLCARNASAGPENFVRQPQRTFATLSARSCRTGMSARRLLSRGKRTLHEQHISVGFDPQRTSACAVPQTASPMTTKIDS